MNTYGISDSRFSRSFGFSDDEVKKIVEKFKFKNPLKILDNIKDWYNGYTIPISLDTYIDAYTPWAVMNYLNDIYNQGEKAAPKNYWTKSGASTILQMLFTKEKCFKYKNK